MFAVLMLGRRAAAADKVASLVCRTAIGSRATIKKLDRGILERLARAAFENTMNGHWICAWSPTAGTDATSSTPVTARGQCTGVWRARPSSSPTFRRPPSGG
jgi:hypothetical protein